jgi:hypothetical protein
MKVGIRIEQDDKGEYTVCEFTGAPPRTATHRTASRRSAAPRYTPQRNACSPIKVCHRVCWRFRGGEAAPRATPHKRSARRRWLSFLAAARRCAPLRRATLRFAPHRAATQRNALERIIDAITV